MAEMLAEEAIYQSIYTGEEIDDNIVKSTAHMEDGERHITAEEREKWDGLQSQIDSLSERVTALEQLVASYHPADI